MVLEMIDQLSGTVSVDHVELDAFGNGVPLEVEQSVEVVGFFPPVLPQIHAPLHYLRVVARTYDVLALRIVLFVLH